MHYSEFVDDELLKKAKKIIPVEKTQDYYQGYFDAFTMAAIFLSRTLNSEMSKAVGQYFLAHCNAAEQQIEATSKQVNKKPG